MDGGINIIIIFGIMYVLFWTSHPSKPYQKCLCLANYYEFLSFWCTHTIKVFLQGNSFINKASVQGFFKAFSYINGYQLFLSLHLLVGVKDVHVC